ncbi:MAG: hypothetical protein FKY71_17375 [Spiribacter salinus]|uniref:Uncharacterized protein n=1 Tax=Spiribacter salinus TaxID=1335746 RepID=A0A540VFW0_9GAMM|nr:MAG: hypothetical protein FKY71_17375 [Spiribacter salinus]
MSKLGKDRKAESTEDSMDTDAGAVLREDKEEGHLYVDLLPRIIVEDATDGRRDSISQCADMVADMIECDLKFPFDGPAPKQQELYLIDWILNALRAIGQGEQPDLAFAWKVPGSGRGRKKPGALESLNRQMAAYRVSGLAKSGEADSVEAAVAMVAEELGKPEETIWKYYTNHRDYPMHELVPRKK